MPCGLMDEKRCKKSSTYPRSTRSLNAASWPALAARWTAVISSPSGERLLQSLRDNFFNVLKSPVEAAVWTITQDRRRIEGEQLNIFSIKLFGVKESFERSVALLSQKLRRISDNRSSHWIHTTVNFGYPLWWMQPCIQMINYCKKSESYNR